MSYSPKLPVYIRRKMIWIISGLLASYMEPAAGHLTCRSLGGEEVNTAKMEVSRCFRFTDSMSTRSRPASLLGFSGRCIASWSTSYAFRRPERRYRISPHMLTSRDTSRFASTKQLHQEGPE